MKLSDITANLPEIRKESQARSQIRKSLENSGRRLIVIDDDPTGTQTVHGVRVYMDWPVEVLRRALKEPVFYLSTNSRSLNSEDARRLNHELGRNLKVAARLEKVDVLLASRSDSTLRGHFPDEVQALSSGLGRSFDGIIIVPAFFEAGRYTIGDVHFVEQGGEIVAADRTEFAKDPVFGYRHGNLKLWVEEKTRGAIKAEDVHSISIETIREGGAEGVAEELSKVSSGMPVVVNAVCYQDIEVFVLGLLTAESKGKEFIYRCAASFVKVRGGFEDKPLLTHDEMMPKEGPGIVVVGSYVEKTTRQLNNLLESGLAAGVELDVRRLLNEKEQGNEIRGAVEKVNEKLARGFSTAIYTSRDLSKEGDFLKTGRIIMSCICEAVKGIRIQPGFVIAKGGITSIELARSALGVSDALVLGQVANGVPVWKLGRESRWAGIPYIVFPGNVGDDMTLSHVTAVLKGANSA